MKIKWWRLTDCWMGQNITRPGIQPWISLPPWLQEFQINVVRKLRVVRRK